MVISTSAAACLGFILKKAMAQKRAATNGPMIKEVFTALQEILYQVYVTHSFNSFSVYASPYCFNTSGGTPFHWFGLLPW